MLAYIIKHPLGKTSLLFILICSIIFLLAGLLAPLLVPIIISFALYAILEPISTLIERLGLSKNNASLSVLLLLVAIGSLCTSLLLPQFSTQLSSLQTQIPHIWQTITAYGNDITQQLIKSIGLDTQASKLTEHILNQTSNWGKNALIEASNILISFSLLVILIPLFTFFLIRDYKKFRNFILDKLPNSSFEMGWRIYFQVAHQLQEYIRGIMIQSIIMSIITTIGFYIIGHDSPLLLGVTSGVLNLIPYVGPLLAMILPVLLAIGQTPLEPWLLGASISVILTAQIIDNVLVIPSVIASAVNLHPLFVIIGIIVFGNIFGFLGMVVAIPVISSLNIIFSGLYQGIQNRHNSQISNQNTQMQKAH